MTEYLPPDARLRLLLEDNGVAFKSLRLARGGLEHHLYHVHLDDGSVCFGKVPRDGYVDPHWPEKRADHALRIERQAIGLIAARCGADLSVPTPYTVLDGNPPGALMGVVPGSTPEHLLVTRGMDLRLLRRIVHEMGRVLAILHRVKRPEDPGDIPDLPGADLEDARLLHMDYHMGNVLGALQLGFGWQCRGVVDWTCAHWGPREADVGEMGASLFATNPDLLDEFLAGYRTSTGIGMRRERVLDFLVAELERRLRDDPPKDVRIQNLWVARVEEWSRQV